MSPVPVAIEQLAGLGGCSARAARSPAPAHAQPADQPPTAGSGRGRPRRGARQGASRAARPTWIATQRKAGSRLSRSQRVGVPSAPPSTNDPSTSATRWPVPVGPVDHALGQRPACRVDNRLVQEERSVGDHEYRSRRRSSCPRRAACRPLPAESSPRPALSGSWTVSGPPRHRRPRPRDRPAWCKLAAGPTRCRPSNHSAGIGGRSWPSSAAGRPSRPHVAILFRFGLAAPDQPPRRGLPPRSSSTRRGIEVAHDVD